MYTTKQQMRQSDRDTSGGGAQLMHYKERTSECSLGVPNDG